MRGQFKRQVSGLLPTEPESPGLGPRNLRVSPAPPRYCNAQDIYITKRKMKPWGKWVRTSSDWNPIFRGLGWDWSTSSASPPSPGWRGAGPLRCVEHQPVPLPLHVILLGLLRDVEAVKLQLPGQFLLPLKDHQGHLDCAGRPRGGRQETAAPAGARRCCGSLRETPPPHQRRVPRGRRAVMWKRGQRVSAGDGKKYRGEPRSGGGCGLRPPRRRRNLMRR